MKIKPKSVREVDYDNFQARKQAGEPLCNEAKQRHYQNRRDRQRDAALDRFMERKRNERHGF